MTRYITQIFVNNLVYIFLLVTNFIFVTDLLIYLFFALNYNYLIIIPFVVIVTIVNVFFVKKIKEKLYRKLNYIFYFFIFIIVGLHIYALALNYNAVIGKYYLESVNLDKLEILLKEYVSAERACPESMNDLFLKVNKKRLINKNIYSSIRLTESDVKCIIYSLGVDNVDNYAKVIIGDDDIGYSQYYPPWNGMVLGSFILGLLNTNIKLEGDIVRTVSKRVDAN